MVIIIKVEICIFKDQGEHIMKDNLKGLIYILIGPSASGKTTLMDALTREFYRGPSEKKRCSVSECRNNTKSIKRIITSTTRKPRFGERNGVNYWFLTEEEFEREKNENNVIGETIYAGHHYGILKSKITSILEDGCSGIIVLDKYGVEELKSIYGENRVKSIFIYRSIEAIYKNLRKRQIPETEVLSRYEVAKEELKLMDSCDYVVKNTGSIDEAVCSICRIIRRV